MKVVAQNRRARFDYEITDTVEAGLILTGQEVKSCRLGHVNLSGAYVSFLAGKAVLKHAKVSPYPFAGPLPDYNPDRDRALLLGAHEAAKLAGLSAEKGVALIPLEVRAGRYIKVLLGIGRGRKTLDKRQRIRERDMEKKLRAGSEI